MSEKICVECKEPITGESVFYNEDFIVCKPCHDTTERNWKEDKKMLRDQGIDPDACTFIEDQLKRPEVGIESETIQRAGKFATERYGEEALGNVGFADQLIEDWSKELAAFAESETAALTAERDRLKAVVEHYADEGNWECVCDDVSHTACDYLQYIPDTEETRHGYQVAQEALKEGNE